MFYSHTYLARKSPLGTVWIAAHLQHKLRKNHVTHTNISSTVDSIMYPEVPIALRLSAHLLLGVVRIYSRKVDYLHHDCTEILTRIRTAFISVQDINLPEDATSAPFHSITLPDTFELDALNLDDESYNERSVDTHLKSLEDITMTDQIPSVGDPYVAFFINEDITMSISPVMQTPNTEARPMEVDVPSVQEDIGAGVSDLNVSSQNVSENHLNEEARPEIELMCDATDNFELENLQDLIAPDCGIIEEHGHMEQDMNEKENLSPIMEDVSVSGGQSLPSQLRSDLPSPFASARSLENLNPCVSPELAIRPTPQEEKKKPKSRKRNRMFDTTVVLSNRIIKEGLNDCSSLVSKRKKLPCSALDVWRFKNRPRLEQSFFESLFSGLCMDVQQLLNKEIMSLKVCKFSMEKTVPGGMDTSSNSLPDIDMEVEHLRAAEQQDNGSSLPEFALSPPRRDELTPTRNLGSMEETQDTLETEMLQTLGATEAAASLRSDLETPATYMESQLGVEETGLSDISEFGHSTEGDLYFLEADNTPIGREENDLHTLSVRTRAVARYLKEQSPVTEVLKNQTGNLSLNKILEGKTRKQCARMFFETLVLKSYSFIDVLQEEAYGDITLLLSPLSNAKF